MPASIRHGYIVLADITGFTPFVAGSEIDHAQVIHSNVMNFLRRHLTPVLTLAEIEGDALFLHAPHDRLRRGETLLELIESTYVAFRDRIRLMERNVVCPCEACRMIPTLDLKFITHYGEYVMQESKTGSKPFGSCINLAHRLLKNDITETTGWHAYALFTEPALEQMGVEPGGMHTGEATYPHLGATKIAAFDLMHRYDELTGVRVSFLAAADAHVTVHRTYSAPRSMLWELLTEPARRNAWQLGSDWVVAARPSGRATTGATNHCAASGFLEEMLDWRPFDYYTVALLYKAVRIRITGELTGDGDPVHVRWSMALESVLPRFLRGPACRLFARYMMRVSESFTRLDRIVAAETPVTAVETADA